MAQVTTFTASDFGRTFRRDGPVQHAVGKSSVSLANTYGGGVLRGTLYGQFPTLGLADQMRGGRRAGTRQLG